MARIQSAFPEIQDLVLNAFPSRLIQMDKAVKVSNTIVALGKNKKIYVSGIKQNAYCSDKISRMAEILEGCVKLGVLSKAVFEQYKKSLKEFEYKQHQSYCASSVLQKMNELGIKLTAAQKSRLDRLNTASPGF